MFVHTVGAVTKALTKNNLLDGIISDCLIVEIQVYPCGVRKMDEFFLGIGLSLIHI